jgi:hypothetical protein
MSLSDEDQADCDCCPHCRKPFEIVHVKLRLNGTATVACCPNCAMVSTAARRLFFKDDVVPNETTRQRTAAPDDPSLAHRRNRFVQRQIRLLGRPSPWSRSAAQTR